MPLHLSTLFFFLTITATFSQNITGIDVSRWQGDVDWELVVLSGKTFAFVKATEGMTYTDPKFHQNMKQGTKAGMIMGAYHFARPDNNTPLQDATNYLNAMGPYFGENTLPPALDLENPGNGTNLSELYTSEALTKWALEWLSIVESKTGYTPIVYTNGFYAAYLQPEINQYDLWIAKPGTSPSDPPTNIGVWNDWAIKQYTWEGQVDGINGFVDLNVFNGSPLAFLNFINPPTSVENSFWDNKSYVYPNPVSDVLYLENVPVDALLQVYDFLGNRVMQRTNNDHLIDVSELTAGSYFLRIQHKDQFQIRTFIKTE